MRLVLTQSLIIAAKDTRVFLKDRFGLGFALLFPLIFVLGFSLALRNLGPGDERLSITVATHEEEGISRQIIELLAEDDIVDLTEMEYAAAVRAVDDEDIGGFVAFPADFTSSLEEGRPTKLEVVAQIGAPRDGSRAHGVRARRGSSLLQHDDSPPGHRADSRRGGLATGHGGVRTRQ